MVRLVYICAALAAGVQGLSASVLVLDEMRVAGGRVANETPAAIVAMPVSQLRFEPRADVQGRNTAEGQADIAIRGGTFENTSFRIGGITVFDPQTGHYLAELPISPDMLLAPRILTGVEHAAGSLNALAGGVAYDWAPISTRGRAEASFGPRSFNGQTLYQGVSRPLSGGSRIGFDFELSRSESKGPRLEDLDVTLGPPPIGAIRGPGDVGEHVFDRISLRMRHDGDATATQAFYGYQHKHFSWPNLYTPFGWPESENIMTNLLMLQHRVELSPDARIQFDAYYRRNRDDYEADTRLPGRFRPYQHLTEVTGGAFSGEFATGSLDWQVGGTALADSIESTELEPTSPGSQGRFASRSLWQVHVLPSHTIRHDAGASTRFAAGAVYDGSSRESDHVAPIAEIRHVRTGWEAYVSYAGGSQVAGYTALNSNPAAGLFRGNPNLGRATTGTWEAGGALMGDGWRVDGAVFHRRDRGLTDWVLVSAVPTAARFAARVDADTTGIELTGRRTFGAVDVVGGYTWLTKSLAYPGFGGPVFGSFYSGNFPEHRATLAIVARPFAGFEVRIDNEYRVQEPNLLRVGSREAVFTSLGLSYRPPVHPAVEFFGVVDNFWDDRLQRVPAVPATPLTWSAGIGYRW
jgi:hypothetical protein